MASRNSVTVTGNLAADPERFTTAGGRSGVRGTVVENIGYKPRNGGEYVETDPVFWPFTVWDEGLAENVAASLSKGARVTVTGRYTNNVWTGEDGVKRSRLELTADEVAASLRFATATLVRQGRSIDAPPPLDEPPF